jgi:hypothetical protein
VTVLCDGGGLEEGSDYPEEDVLQMQLEPLEEDTYGFAIASIVRDVGWLSKGSDLFFTRMARLASSLTLLGFTVFLQVFLLRFAKTMLTAAQVHAIRGTYSEFEKHMYPNHTIMIYHGEAGYYRGIDGYRVDSQFDTLPEDLKESVCEIPLSQPEYLFAVLFIWTVSCVQQFKYVIFRFRQMILNTETLQSMQFSTDVDSEDPKRQVVRGLTMTIKVALTTLVFLPQVLIICFLLFLGSRWLLATNSLLEILLNAVALEFILQLKDVLYLAFVPLRSKLDTQSTVILPHKQRSHLSCLDICGSIIWLAPVLIWVSYYLTIGQNVLPQYRWDVRDVCATYLAKERAV